MLLRKYIFCKWVNYFYLIRQSECIAKLYSDLLFKKYYNCYECSNNSSFLSHLSRLIIKEVSSFINYMLILTCSYMVPVSHVHSSCIAIIATVYLVKYSLLLSYNSYCVPSEIFLAASEKEIQYKVCNTNVQK